MAREAAEINSGFYKDVWIMLDRCFRRKSNWLYAFFFAGDYPLALQLAIVNALCIVALQSGRDRCLPSAQGRSLTRLFTWLAISRPTSC